MTARLPTAGVLFMLRYPLLLAALLLGRARLTQARCASEGSPCEDPSLARRACVVILAAVVILAFCLPAARGQSGNVKPGGGQSPASVKTTPPLGISLGKVPDLLYDHLRLPNLKRGHGVVVYRIAPDSPAAGSGLEHNDIVLSCNGTQVQTGAQLVRLLKDTPPQSKMHVLLVRGGQETRVSLRLTAPGSTGNAAAVPNPKALLKSDGPPKISVKAEPLAGGKLRITFLFYSEGKGKFDQVTCSGSFKEIQAQVHTLGRQNQIPPQIRELVDVALKRIRNLNVP